MDRTLRLSPIADLTSHLREGAVVAFNVGPDGLAYLAIARNPLDYRRTEANGCSFAKTIPDQPQTYRVIAVDGNDIRHDVEIRNETFNIHEIQPLSATEFLLVCCRSYYYGPDEFDKNGRVYTRQGVFVRDLLLGDGIKSVQTTLEGKIWTSFSDEGIFGNLGWDNPVGASGLVAWDSFGNRLYEFEATGGLDSMVDCYALNVESDGDVWCYYYSSFPLVRLRGGRIDASWEIPISGSDAFAVSEGLALFRGGYKKRDGFHLLELRPDAKAKELAHVQFEDERGNALVGDWVVARGDSMYMLNDSRLYRVDLEMTAA